MDSVVIHIYTFQALLNLTQMEAPIGSIPRAWSIHIHGSFVCCPALVCAQGANLRQHLSAMPGQHFLLQFRIIPMRFDALW